MKEAPVIVMDVKKPIANPETYKIEKMIVDNSRILKLQLAKGGVAAISIMPATAEEIRFLK